MHCFVINSQGNFGQMLLWNKFTTFLDASVTYLVILCRQVQDCYCDTLNEVPPLITDGVAIGWPARLTMVTGWAVLVDRLKVVPLATAEDPLNEAR